ncbi:ankyrin repeat domain-containing protein [Mycolicibacterium komossense]|uniref:Ankyrin repeat domain-containing protein n=1 Tax=Mycolicibacterium komossense TaxID=1779 RepID=A0ABT3C9L4_9MYCO|nr:ankyrin repeat domain-containing protein [Mycolicibacterium komossense]MCV7226168.1 ankyrin repeat domain-containing protein [Mycolicibacterium komossense]
MTDPVDDLDDEVLGLAQRLFEMARAGEAISLAAYLDAGAPVDLTNAAGDTLVMLAAYHGHADTVRTLADRGADVNRVNDRGQSPLAGAVFKGADDVVRVLVDAGADPTGGAPNAIDTARMFERGGYLEMFGESGPTRGR